MNNFSLDSIASEVSHNEDKDKKQKEKIRVNNPIGNEPVDGRGVLRLE